MKGTILKAVAGLVILLCVAGALWFTGVFRRDTRASSELDAAALRQDWAWITDRVDPATADTPLGKMLRARVLRLRAGDTSALKEAVLSSRPRTGSLAWAVPLEGWEIPGALPAPDPSVPDGARTAAHPAAQQPDQGCSIEAQVRKSGAPPLMYDGPFRAPNVRIPAFRFYEKLLPKAEIAVPKAGARGADDRGGVSADIQIRPEDFSAGKEKKK